MIALRPTRQRVALADLPLTDLHPHVLAEEVNQRATPLATFYTALNQSREPGLSAFSELTHHTPISTRTLPIAITFFVEDEKRIADVPSGVIGVEGLPEPPEGTHTNWLFGTTNRKVAVEYVNPSITQAFLQRGLEVIGVVDIVEGARVIKSDDEIACIRWACAVAEHGIARMQESMGPGVTEAQLWGLLNYTNLANQGGWHEGRMLASGPRINPWLQEATQRVIEEGDLVGFDTDMVVPFGYFCGVSRTFYYGNEPPTARQRQLYRLA